MFGFRHVLFRFRLTGGYGHTGDFDLVADMRAGKVDLLVIMGGNPVYDAPADLGFGDALKSSGISLRIHHGLYQNETSEYCHWHVNEAHCLEAWSDAKAASALPGNSGG